MTFRAALLCLATGCGLGWVDNPSGGSDHLPTQGAGPYGKLEIDLATAANEPYVVAIPRVSLFDPSPLPDPDGGFELWFSHRADPDVLHAEIWSAGLPALTELPDPGPRPAVQPDQPWEQDWVSAPCVMRAPDDSLVMFYQGGFDSPAIGRADSRDGGASWQKSDQNPVLDRAAEPACALLPDGRWLLYVTRPDSAGIFRADSDNGVDWTPRQDPVLLPRTDNPDAFDRYAVTDPWIVVRTPETGQVHYGLFFNGVDEPGENATVSVGWAGSFDGIEWRRFASPDGAVLAPEGESEHGPGVILEPDHGVMFFSEVSQAVQTIAAAVHP